MENYSFQIFMTQGILVLVLCALIFYLIRERRIIRLEKRFEKFSLLSTKESDKSIFDMMVSYLWKFIHKASFICSKSIFLKKYSQRYEKYISFEKKEEITGMDYIALKCFLSIFLIVLYFITSMFQVKNVNFFFSILLFVFGFFLPDIFLQIAYQKKRKKIEEDLLKAIIMMNNSFKSGRNIMQAVEIVKDELEGPISDEFKKIYLDMTYGLSLEVVFDRFYNRVKLEDAKYITSSLTLLNKTGGNIVKVFQTIERSFFDKKKLKQEMASLTSASLFVFRVLCVLPFLFILIIFLLNPTYFEPVFTTSLGRMILILTLGIYLFYIFVIKKVLEVRI